MEGHRSSPPPPTLAAGNRRQREQSVAASMKKNCLSFAASVQESFRSLKATLVGQAKKVTARNEKEATEAYLQTAKMQVEAADDAEETKKSLNKSI
ncbi:hypothetical protein Acr_00g0088390 [Actinidia rufa]|uniref:Uncharacterized protein n=1 Tax=Actinidia rufa TaxID=165716 RepID=A0A7J0DWF0_9ERIC|nr:hypothetical protein Acr_00g0088390 [Actinidia rufa]